MVEVCCHFTQTSLIMVGFSHTSLGVLLVVFNLFQFENNLRKTPLKLQSPIFWMQSHLDHRLAFLSYLFTAHLRSTQQSWRSHVPGLKTSSLMQWGPVSGSWLSCSMNTGCANYVLQKFCSIKICLQHQCNCVYRSGLSSFWLELGLDLFGYCGAFWRLFNFAGVVFLWHHGAVRLVNYSFTQADFIIWWEKLHSSKTQPES